MLLVDNQKVTPVRCSMWSFFNKFHFPRSISVNFLALENALSVDFKNAKWIIFLPGELLP